MKRIIPILIILVTQWVFLFSTTTSESNDLKKTPIKIEENFNIDYLEIEDTSKREEYFFDEEVISTKPIIYIDAGHGCLNNSYKINKAFGFTSEGAKGEAEYVLSFSEDLIERLKDEDKYTIYDIGDISLRGVSGSRELFGNSARIDGFIKSDADIMIQIHYDDSNDKTLSGGHIIMNSTMGDSEILARLIVEEMRENELRINDEYYEDGLSNRWDLTLLSRRTKKIVLLIELGYGVPGKMDYEYLRDEEIREKLMKSIIDGLNEYFKENF